MFEYKGSLVINYTLKTLTGLRIGGSKEQFEIGGLDNPVIKTEVEIPDYDGNGKTLPQGAPYIPGSSLKGKMRSLLEWAEDRVKEMIDMMLRDSKTENSKKIEEAGKACKCGKCKICKVFGTGDAETIKKIAETGEFEELPGPTRLKVFDAYPTWESLERLKEALGENIFTEIKTENQINRLTSRANPRKVERVPAGVEFSGTMVFDLYKKGDEELFKLVLQGMKLLENNYLGGYGSRGSGKIKFTNITLKWRPKEYFLGKKEEKESKEYSTVDQLIKDIDELLKKFEIKS